MSLWLSPIQCDLIDHTPSAIRSTHTLACDQAASSATPELGPLDDRQSQGSHQLLAAIEHRHPCTIQSHRRDPIGCPGTVVTWTRQPVLQPSTVALHRSMQSTGDSHGPCMLPRMSTADPAHIHIYTQPQPPRLPRCLQPSSQPRTGCRPRGVARTVKPAIARQGKAWHVLPWQTHAHAQCCFLGLLAPTCASAAPPAPGSLAHTEPSILATESEPPPVSRPFRDTPAQSSHTPTQTQTHTDMPSKSGKASAGKGKAKAEAAPKKAAGAKKGGAKKGGAKKGAAAAAAEKSS